MESALIARSHAAKPGLQHDCRMNVMQRMWLICLDDIFTSLSSSTRINNVTACLTHCPMDTNDRSVSFCKVLRKFQRTECRVNAKNSHQICFHVHTPKHGQ